MYDYKAARQRYRGTVPLLERITSSIIPDIVQCGSRELAKHEWYSQMNCVHFIDVPQRGEIILVTFLALGFTLCDIAPGIFSQFVYNQRLPKDLQLNYDDFE